MVVTSTDYDMDQAEELVIESCSETSCTAWGELVYTHHGRIYRDTVDMRAEVGWWRQEAVWSLVQVGLLTRNIRISGEVLNESDTYGGHIKAWPGFSVFRLAGLELTRMGQQGIKVYQTDLTPVVH